MIFMSLWGSPGKKIRLKLGFCPNRILLHWPCIQMNRNVKSMRSCVRPFEQNGGGKLIWWRRRALRQWKALPLTALPLQRQAFSTPTLFQAQLLYFYHEMSYACHLQATITKTAQILNSIQHSCTWDAVYINIPPVLFLDIFNFKSISVICCQCIGKMTTI